MRLRIAVSTGDPHGIGPEVTRAALQDTLVLDACECVVFGGLDAATGAGRGPTAAGGRASYDAVMGAVEAVKSGRCDALVTAPISKEAWHLAGITRYPGHTELLAEAFESPVSAMLFVGPTLRVMLATIHVALADVAPAIGRMGVEGVLAKIELCARAMRELGVERPRVAVAGLNPHAGEHGLIGREDMEVLVPAVALARARGIDASGPHPGDAVFMRAADGGFDAVLAMYHDQGLIPVKLLDRRRTVNTTVGLSWKGRAVVRTSPAHGTAYDIAGRGAADATSMKEALLLAARMARAPRAAGD